MAIDDEADRLSALTDDLLNHVLSFLPSVDAARTSVLARRWRHLWRSTRALCVTDRRDGAAWTPWTLNSLVNRLLLLRGCAPLDDFEVFCGNITDFDDDYSDAYYSDADDYYYSRDEERSRRRQRDKAELSRIAAPWIHHVLTFCQARVLSLCVHVDVPPRTVHDDPRRLQIVDAPFASRLLTTLYLGDAELTFRSLDLSRCPALEDLSLVSCKVHVDRILSPSLRRLGIHGCDFRGDARTRISTPRVISLQLTLNSGRAPVLDKMPLLEAASVRFQDGYFMYACEDICKNKDNKSYSGDCDDRECQGCYGSSFHGSSSLILEGLSGAAELELTSDPSVFIFRRDFKLCTIFSKLKALVLNEWCVKPNFGALDYFLRHSPILEKLTIQLEDWWIQDDAVIADENHTPTGQFSVPKQLKTVKIKWYKDEKLAQKIMMILLETYGVPPEQISIEKFDPFDRFNCRTEVVDSGNDNLLR